MGSREIARLVGHWLLAALLTLGSGTLERLTMLVHAPACACCADARTMSCCARPARAADAPSVRAAARGCGCALTRAPEAPVRVGVHASGARGTSRAHLALGLRSAARLSALSADPCIVVTLAPPLPRSTSGPPGARRACGGERAFALGVVLL